MGSLSIWHLLILLLVVLLLFGKGKISEIMGDVASGIKSFRKGMSEDDTASKPTPEAPKTIEAQPQKPVEQPGVQSKAG